LSHRAYPDADTWSLDVERVLSNVKWALSTLDPTAEVVLVERWLEYAARGKATYPPFRLRHSVDLVLEHEDGTLEHVDWKTGKRAEADEVQMVTARIVVRCAFPPNRRIVSATAFLDREEVQRDEMTREQVCAGWDRITRSIAAIEAERNWYPSSNALCPWCPLYRRGCDLYPAPGG
jgi:hypothetical protein